MSRKFLSQKQNKTTRFMSVNWVVCGTRYTKIEALSCVVLSCSVPVNFFQVECHLDHLRGQPDVVPAVALWLTCSLALIIL